MEHDFWHARWKANQIGFHEGKENALVSAYFPDLDLAPNARVFLPLCGKTRDIAWLRAQGFRVAGAELSEIAIIQLFDELGVTPSVTKVGDHKRYHAQDIDIFVGDIFALSAPQLGAVDAVIDRAALVALPAEMRKQYTAHLATLSNHAPQLVVTFTYDQTMADGPPFSVDSAEIQAHYADHYVVSQLAQQETHIRRTQAVETITKLVPH